MPVNCPRTCIVPASFRRLTRCESRRNYPADGLHGYAASFCTKRKLHDPETGQFRAEPLSEELQVLSGDEIDPETLVPEWDCFPQEGYLQRGGYAGYLTRSSSG